MIELLPAVIIVASVYVLARIVGFIEGSVKQEKARKEEEDRKRKLDQLYGRYHT